MLLANSDRHRANHARSPAALLADGSSLACQRHMKKWIAASAAVATGAVVLARSASRRVAALEQVFSDHNFQITGVTQ